MADELKTIETVDLSPFKCMVMTIGEMPSSFVESMTYYEALAWLDNYLEKTLIPAVNNNAEAVKELQNLYIELHAYVENYFDNLDVQEEINNKLDAMADAGTLQEIIGEYLNATAIWGFDTVAGMKAAENLVDGSFAKTLGFLAKNDCGGATYKIRNITNDDVIDEKSIIALADDNLVAELIIMPSMNVKQFGATDGGDIYSTLAKMLSFNIINEIDLLGKSFTLNTLLTLRSNITIKNGILTSANLFKVMEGTNLHNVNLINLEFNGSNNCEKAVYLTSCKDVVISKCIMHDFEVLTGSSSGIDTHSCSFITIEDSEFYDFGNNSDTTSQLNYEPRGIILENSTNCTIDNCYVHDVYTINNHGDGVQFVSPVSRVFSDNVIRNSLIEDCIYRGIKIQQIGVTVDNCKIAAGTNNRALQQAGISVYDSNVKVINCYIDQLCDCAVEVGTSNDITTVADNVIVADNIFKFDKSIAYGVITCKGLASMISNLSITGNKFIITDVNEKPFAIEILDNFDGITIANNIVDGGETFITLRKKSGAVSQSKNNLVVIGNNANVKQSFMEFGDNLEISNGTIVGNYGYYKTPLEFVSGQNTIRSSDITLYKTFIIHDNNIVASNSVKINDGPRAYGSSSNRPTTAVNNGYQYFDTTLHQLLVFYSNKWYKPDGTEAV